MAVPTHIGDSSPITTNGVAPGAITPHASTATGDLLIWYHFSKINTNSTQSVTPPTGFTTIFNSRSAVGLIAAAWKFRAGGETTYTATIANHVSGNSGDAICEFIETWRGTDDYAPISVGGFPIATDAVSDLTVAATSSNSQVQVPTDGVWIIMGGREENTTAQTTLSGDGLTWTADMLIDTTLGSDASLVTQYGVNTTGSPVTVTPKTITVTGTSTTSSSGNFMLKPYVQPNLDVSPSSMTFSWAL